MKTITTEAIQEYYSILKLPFGASRNEIKRAYKGLAKEYHPDVSSRSNAHDLFVKMQTAYFALIDVTSDPNWQSYYEDVSTSNSKNKTNCKEKKSTCHDTSQQRNKTEQSETYSKKYDDWFKEWEGRYKTKAEEYASMSFNKFKRRILDEIKIGISYTGNIIFIAFCILLFISMGSVLLEIGEEKPPALVVMVIVVMTLGLGITIYFLTKNMISNYKADRTNKLQ